MIELNYIFCVTIPLISVWRHAELKLTIEYPIVLSETANYIRGMTFLQFMEQVELGGIWCTDVWGKETRAALSDRRLLLLSWVLCHRCCLRLPLLTSGHCGLHLFPEQVSWEQPWTSHCELLCYLKNPNITIYTVHFLLGRLIKKQSTCNKTLKL